MRDTSLAKMYEEGSYTPPTKEEYVELAIYILTHVSPQIIIHRLTGDCPKDLLLAPMWNREKNEIINTIVYKMQLNGLSQGCKH